MAEGEYDAQSAHSLGCLQWRHHQHHDPAQTGPGGYLDRLCAPAQRVCSHQRRAGPDCTSEPRMRSQSS